MKKLASLALALTLLRPESAISQVKPTQKEGGNSVVSTDISKRLKSVINERMAEQGLKGSVCIQDKKGDRLIDVNCDVPTLVASQQKMLTVLMYLNEARGLNERPKVHFFVDSNNNLTIKGEMAMLMSEDFKDVADTLRAKGMSTINQIYFDHSFLGASTLDVPGVNSKNEVGPSGAPVSSFILDFNILDPLSQRDSRANVVLQDRIQQGKGGPINIGEKDIVAVQTIRVAELLAKYGITVADSAYQTKPEKPIPVSGGTSFDIEEKWSPEQKSKLLLEYSNNLLANQMWLLAYRWQQIRNTQSDTSITGKIKAKISSLVGSPSKSNQINIKEAQQALEQFTQKTMGFQVHINDGSGMSSSQSGGLLDREKTRITAQNLIKIVRYFEENGLSHLLRDYKRGATIYLHGKGGEVAGYSGLTGTMGSDKLFVSMNFEKDGGNDFSRTRIEFLDLVHNWLIPKK